MVKSFQFNKIKENIYQILNKFISAWYITDNQFICPQILHYTEYLARMVKDYNSYLSNTGASH